MPTIDALSERLSHYLSRQQVQQVRRAYYYAEQAHDGQRRRSGEPYIIHPLAVASILADMHLDYQSLMAAMLHDVIEDTGIPKPALATQFGDVVTDLVDGVSKLTHIHFEDKQQQQAENFQKMAMAMAKDIRVILVKLADRLHNMRTLGSLRPDKRRRIARETLDIYSPIAHRLGLNSIRVEMEDLCFEAMHPMRSNLIRKAVKNHRGRHAEIISQISNSIRNRLSEYNISARVVGREKHLYSIYSKMARSKKKDIDEIMDVYGFRIITSEVDTCYRILGLMHGLYKPISGRFKDYVAIPKANGYQSLHTTLFNAGDVPIEIQIRTEEMDAMANYGIAAHWLYKSESDQISGSQRAHQWVQNLLELQKNAGSPLEFVEHVKVDLFPDEIYVFTPKGKILTLTAGATAIDFAYAVHTDVGNQCIACRIDRQLSPLSAKLQSGQTVQIVTAANAQPNPAWLNFVVSGKARSNIRSYLKNQRQSESVALGERLLNKALAGLDKSLDDISHDQIDLVLKETGLEHLDDLLEEIGSGNRMAPLMARRFLAAYRDTDIDLQASAEQPLSISGTEGLVVSFAKCCSPIPGDPIIGHVSSGKGLVVHTETCRNIEDLRNNPEKCVTLRWEKDIHSEFTVNLKVYMENRRGLIVDLASAIHTADASIDKISVEERDARLSVTQLKVNIQGRKHLARVIRKLRNVSGVNKIVRLKS
ncbi:MULTISPECIES: bifunctional GTP diphosphokinase/guanosine-3',5'-bis pyrophosphate 3'-pyrophosphohydrolase [unclassified Oceanobacter]|jgi:RelA/SpoT family (p)ppGpp synthetase|uniref:bifunctional GTP diphosphokinase/guanosine-3',5'-bis pyrophosphate 3'-pyrophosphohydrolase n=2 Tax=Gammaproteobacteria TaxID=1236 RepID=UPI0026E166BC|nr:MULTISPECIES: bifunctional GTP diphosphokinase/guanosine-3',5'-bis pyrophosphate 3'-pyrophosphohydrolase [unclassified Oceanobacter]MDO6683398.1 bifunctional GTP diphosphokinase/guanosine-3',5'-bis pyrophosphate 3'-pyrophosphohydrolase [Oceanobacter sp. 5_MG-2023]MDP2506872.1 bifunctional GTP diphosphokinase/guanosine-3',5'-bis pyrophosphate 3'-pyrophosphohydrolase [Oceanobacter sp. 3_MG-2023]MDP2547799.1 bifunctional GTP diphosphokinase/guanosine-3',5'-bis pyrophosphate 3'-pyrophosphohydrola